MMMNRRERRKYAAELRALAAAGMEVGEVEKCRSAASPSVAAVEPNTF
jgi:hypothetical protein